MWYHGFGNRQRIELTPSVHLYAAVAILHGLLALAILAADISALLQWPLLLFNALALRRHLICWAFPALELAAEAVILDGQGRLLSDEPEPRPFYLAGVVWISPRILVLRLWASGAYWPRWLILATHSKQPQALRRLRVRLRFGGLERVGPFRGLRPSWPVRWQ